MILMSVRFCPYICYVLVCLFTAALRIHAAGVQPRLSFRSVSLPYFSPVAMLITENGAIPQEDTVLEPGETYTGAAPLEFRFVWNTASGEDMNDTHLLRFEWEFSRDISFRDVFLRRFDAETIYSFQESGSFFVRLTVTDGSTGDTALSDVFVIKVAESELKVPNAFSPNGDGVNDVFRVKHKSLVYFQAYIFNRWGQQLYRYSLPDIDRGWDGTSNGKEVPDGVYFIVVEAEGADGIRYRIKSDINILR